MASKTDLFNEKSTVYFYEGERLFRFALNKELKPDRFRKIVKICEGDLSECSKISTALNLIVKNNLAEFESVTNIFK